GLIEDGLVDEARQLFDMMPVKDVVASTKMIDGLCSEAMLTGYTRSGRINEAAELFKEMPVKPVAACNEMIMGFGLDGEVGKASLMQTEGVRPSFPSVISVLSVCGSLASLDHGRQVHSQLVRSQFDIDIYVSSVLITMYIKCGDLVTAKRVFDRFSTRDIVMWNSIIAGYAQHGFGEKALEVFHDMFSSSIAPDEITFIGVLWIEVDKKVHIFSGGGSPSHPEHEMILKKLGKLGALLREAGYCPDGSFVMHDVDEEDKVHSLRDHMTNGNYKHLITGRLQLWLWLLMPRSRWQHFLDPPGDFGAKRCEEQKKLKEKQFQKLYTLIIKVTDVDALLHPSNLRAISTSPGFVPVEERWNVCAYFLTFAVFST
ncbi:hypothetical protein D5086_009696, partial [Populus alba]